MVNSWLKNRHDYKKLLDGSIFQSMIGRALKNKTKNLCPQKSKCSKILSIYFAQNDQDENLSRFTSIDLG